jgi:hypothetical protein
VATPPTTILPPPTPGGGPNGDQQTLVWMLKTIQEVLRLTVYSATPPFPQELRQSFLDAWPSAEESINNTIATVNTQFAMLYPRLQEVGLTGQSLDMKAASLYYHSAPYVGDILTYPAKVPLRERITRFFRPAYKVMNSIMSSLKGIVPGIEIAKEYKEHVEAAAEAVAARE